MKSITVQHYDAFSQTAGKGNPAGIVFHADDLTEEEMQEIALKVGFNETAFPLKSEAADFKIRYFTPGHEINLCGHATIAAVYALKRNGCLGTKTDITIETKAGILSVKVKDERFITMQQAAPRFEAFKGSTAGLAASIGLTEEDIDPRLPILYGSTGTWTLLVPIKKLDAFPNMKPDNVRFPAVLKEKPASSIHSFCLETYDLHAHMHARHFSSPFSGTTEDAVTGTAAGVMGAYYADYIHNPFKGSLHLTVEQGQEMGKDGRVMVDVIKKENSYDIEITGTAVYVKDFDIFLEEEKLNSPA
ncbi:PhzF family phenazine biosynthesis protein [Domibacillus indicus]|uniref:PhzF family phenazine biosynthesis protein n=1 Tax=Domibacillus indicus TaxID=1437523 RepID=UPI000617EDB0|nr:PhzF family phenazine biosynthesis isomerase [Domibacillus indicus]